MITTKQKPIEDTHIHRRERNPNMIDSHQIIKQESKRILQANITAKVIKKY